jgi:thiamine biosynthesis protein ThiI
MIRNGNEFRSLSMKRIIYLKYGELILKGKNKKDFINCLFKNIRFALKFHKKIIINKFHDAVIIENITEKNINKMLNTLKKISGIS